ncbi:MAG: hypothetical protein NXI24_20425 [bacterium]|nr:hypothetical protein [bacterium]
MGSKMHSFSKRYILACLYVGVAIFSCAPGSEKTWRSGIYSIDNRGDEILVGAPGYILKWNFLSGQTEELEGARHWNDVRFYRDGLLTVGGDGQVLFWREGSRKQIRKGEYPLSGLAIYRDFYAIASNDNKVVVYSDIDQEVWLFEDVDPRNTIEAIHIVDDTHVIAGGGRFTSGAWIRIWELRSGKLLKSIEDAHDRGAVVGIASSADGKLFATTSKNRTIRLWGLPDGILLKEFRMVDEMPAIQFGANGRYLFSAGWDGNLHVWETKTFEKVFVKKLDSDSITALYVRDDCDVVIAGAYDGKIQVMNLENDLDCQN